jgi:DNA topoisomerase-2
MIMFSSEGKIRRYETIADIVEEFYSERIKAYGKRKRYLVSKYKRELEIL